MSEETPAGEEPEVTAYGVRGGGRWARRRAREAEVNTPVRQGATAALVLFALAAIADVATLFSVQGSGGEKALDAFLGLGMNLALIGLVAAFVVSAFLPKPARGPFWTTGLVCICMTAILWGVTCGLALG